MILLLLPSIVIYTASNMYADNIFTWLGTPSHQLNLKRREIRLLVLHPGLRDEPISCSTFIASLDQLPAYEALSYVWGKPDALQTSADLNLSLVNNQEHWSSIKVDGSKFMVSENLAAAMRALRFREDSRVLWIDSICINQADNAEKSHQVGMMGAIYEQSQRCLLWLGDEKRPGTARAAFEFINWIANELKDGTHITDFPGFQTSQPMDNPLLPQRRQAVRSHFSRRSTAYDLRDHDISHMATAVSLAELGSSAWWTRVWTVQEAILPTQSSLCYGSESIPWSTIAITAQKMQNHMHDCQQCESLLFWGWNSARLWTFISDIQEVKTQRDSIHLSDLLILFRSRRATNARDHIFAFLGLITSADGMVPLEVNYAVDPKKLYMEATLYAIKASGNLNIVAAVNKDTEKDRMKGLPSWIADWSAKIDSRLYLWEKRRQLLYASYNACGSKYCKPDVKLEKDLLVTRGNLVDKVEKVGFQIMTDPADLHPNIVEELNQFGCTSMRCISEAFRDPTTTAWRNFLGNRRTVYTNERPNKDDYEMLKHWKQEEALPIDLRSVLESNPHRRVVFRSENGHLGIGPPGTKAGDEIYILHGGKAHLCSERSPILIQMLNSGISTWSSVIVFFIM